jgi:hypothetical protein
MAILSCGVSFMRVLSSLSIATACAGVAVVASAPTAAVAEANRLTGVTAEAIDLTIEKSIAQAGLKPAAQTDDAEFLRRLSLDVRGTIPSVEEVIAFLGDKSADKRSKIITAYLNDPLRGSAWANYWDKLLVGSLTETIGNPMQATRLKSGWKEWVAEQFNDNVPYNQFATEVVTAEGPVDVAPETLPTVRWDGATPDLTGTMSRVFLGRQIQCAQCHNHPYDETMTQQMFWESAAFFDRTKVIPMRSMTGRQDGKQVIEKVSGETKIPDFEPATKVSAKWIDGQPGPSGITTELREAFAQFMTQHDQEQFARNFVNRLWAHYTGRGFLEPVDDWQTPGIVPNHPELLSALTTEFIASGMDVRHIEEIILNSRTYQRSSRTEDDLTGYGEFYPVGLIRPLSPEQLFASVDRAVNLSAQAPKARGGAFRESLRDRYASQFTFLFGNDEMEESSDFDANVSQALFLFNDPTLNKALTESKGSIINRVLATTKNAREQVDYLYLATVNRRPTNEERADLATMLEQTPEKERTDALEDILWALVNSAEFRTNH